MRKRWQKERDSLLRLLAFYDTSDAVRMLKDTDDPDVHLKVLSIMLTI